MTADRKSQSLRCAVVGVGYLGRFHAQKYSKLASDPTIAGVVDLIGVADVDPVRAKTVGDELSVPAFTIDALLAKAKDGLLDAVTIAASTPIKSAKLGIVDIEKAIKATSSGQKMSKELQGEFEKKKSEFQKRDGDLRKMFEDLEKKKSLLTEDARQKKASELQQEQMKFQKEVADSQATIQKKERDMLEPIAKKMEELIEKMAKDGNYTAILDRRAILWGAKSADLTDEIVKEFDKSSKK